MKTSNKRCNCFLAHEMLTKIKNPSATNLLSFTQFDFGMNHYSFFRRNNAGDEIEALNNGNPTRAQVRLVENFIEGYEFVEADLPADNVFDATACPICLDDFTNAVNHCVARCGHQMHTECLIRDIVRFGRNTCPTCKQADDVSDEVLSGLAEAARVFGSRRGPM